jgi:hypothetical protein
MKMSMQLLPHQTSHVERLKSILAGNFFAVDTSTTGSGKSYTAMYVAKALGFRHVIFVCPNSVKAKWLALTKEMGIGCTILTYNNVKGGYSGNTIQPGHALLTRTDTWEARTNADPVRKTVFSATPLFRQMCQEGIFFVVDETQGLKNKSDQFLAVSEMTRTMAAGGSANRVLFMSATPLDKQEQCFQYLQLFGITAPDTQLSDWCTVNHQHVWENMRPIYDTSLACNKDITDAYCPVPRGKWDSVKALRPIAYRLFVSAILPAHSAAMNAFPSLLTKYKALYKVLDATEQSILQDSLRNLKVTVAFDESTGKSDLTGNNTGSAFSKITKFLMGIEQGKVGTFARVVKHKLGFPGTKVIVMLHYTASVKALAVQLAEFNPIILTGEVKAELRAELTESFQQPNAERRLIIAITSVVESGIDLDDKHGQFPRTIFANVSYHTMSLMQAAGRVSRANTASAADVVYVFGQGSVESRVLESLARKEGVMTEATPQQLAEGTQYLSSIPTFVEVDSDCTLVQQAPTDA